MANTKKTAKENALNKMKRAVNEQDIEKLYWASLELFIAELREGNKPIAFSGRDVNEFMKVLISSMNNTSGKDIDINDATLVDLRNWKNRRSLPAKPKRPSLAEYKAKAEKKRNKNK